MQISSIQRNVSSKSLVCAAVGALLGTVATAQQQSGGLEEVVVTAQKRGEESLQRIPVTVQALSAEQLAATGATSILDIAGRVPSLSVFDAGGNQKKLKIRGVSSAAESETSETVAVYIDDVPVTNSGGTNNENGASPDVGFFDVERVEVLKGPQGSLYGASSMGGTVRYITKQPNLSEYQSEVFGRFSNTSKGDNSFGLAGMVNLPLSQDRVALRLAATYDDDGGYIDNIAPLTGIGFGPAGKVPGKSDANSAEHWLARAQLAWQVSDAFSLGFKVMRREYDVSGEASVQQALIAAGRDLVQRNFIQAYNQDEFTLYNLTFEYDFGSLSLFSSSSYTDRLTDDLQDTTFFSNIVFGTTDPASNLRNLNDSQEFVQEFRLVSQGEGSTRWVAGVYYSDLDKFFVQDAPFPGINTFLGAPVVPVIPGFLGNQPNVFQSDVPESVKQKAVFGEFTWDFADRWSATLGGRFFDVEREFRYNSRGLFSTPGADSRAGSGSEDGFNPKVSIAFEASETALVYLTASKGYRIGGFNQPIPNTPQCAAELATLGISNSPPLFESDSIWNYEVSAKTTWADNRVRVNGGIYYVDWKDIQLRRQLSCGFTFFLNGGSATVKGAELQLEVAASDALSFYLNIGYDEAKLDGSVPNLGAQADSKLPGVPEITASAGFQFDFPLLSNEGYFRADVSHIGEFNYLFEGQTAPFSGANPTAGDYTIAGLRFGLNAEKWDAALYVNNVFDERADTGLQDNLFANVVFRNRPREIGVSVSRRF